MSVQNMGINYALYTPSGFTVALLEGKEQVAVTAGTDSDTYSGAHALTRAQVRW